MDSHTCAVPLVHAVPCTCPQAVLLPADPSSPVPHLALSSSPDSSTTLFGSPSQSIYSGPPSASSSVSSLPCGDDCCPPAPARDAKPAVQSVEADQFHNVLIIGGGPHGLALAARLAESHPDALYTDLEHARLGWLRREGGGGARAARRVTVKGHWSQRRLIPSEVAPTAALEKDKRGQMVKVLDATSNKWLGRWDSFFAGLRITHLRSPMFFHGSPATADAMVAFAQREGREDELKPIDGVVGKERSKHWKKKSGFSNIRTHFINERERQDFFRPSSKLFRDFVGADLVDRYNLDPPHHSAVQHVSYGPLHVAGQDKLDKAFYVESVDPGGRVVRHGAKAVVLAVGPSSRPCVPEVIRKAAGLAPGGSDVIEGEGWSHSTAFARAEYEFLGKGAVRDKLASRVETTIAVIGGGLTSAQIVDLAVMKGATKVHLICRSHIKTKHFDFDLEWVSKYSNLKMAEFWQEDCRHARRQTILHARDGGSVNPTYHRILRKHAKARRLEMHTCTAVLAAEYDAEGKQWTLELETQAAKTKVGEEAKLPTRTTLLGVDYVVCSTGSVLSLDTLDFLRPLRETHPIELIDGLPRLSPDLQWTEEVPLFIQGAYSMLELGPGALNLSGTRPGAERVARRLNEMGLLEPEEGEEVPVARRGRGETEVYAKRRREKEERSGGLRNFFAGLSVDDE